MLLNTFYLTKTISCLLARDIVWPDVHKDRYNKHNFEVKRRKYLQTECNVS